MDAACRQIGFPQLLLTPGVGARTVRSLAIVAEIVHGAPYRFPIRRGIDDNDIAWMSQAADKLIDEIDRCRTDAMKWYVAALKIAVDWVVVREELPSR